MTSAQDKSNKRCTAGRPRDQEARTRILAAANALLDEKGFKLTTIEAIAERAGTSKATIYRWWSSKAAIVLEAFLEHMAQKSPMPETDSPLQDLRQHLCSFAEALKGRPGVVLAGLVAESLLDAEVGRAYIEHWMMPRRRDAQRHLARAVANGELPEDTNVEFMIDALYGPIYLRLIHRHASLSAAYAESIWNTVIRSAASAGYDRAR